MHISTAPIALAHAHSLQESPDDLLTTPGIRAALGNISEMTLWRWSNTLAFPRPDLIVARRKFWRRSTLQAWIAAQAEKMAADRAEQGATSRREAVAVATVMKVA
jgi:predicted DNA-binding transcriptional regulator AlpA